MVSSTIKSWFSLPVTSYQSWFPHHVDTAHLPAGFPRSGDLLDGVFVALVLSVVRAVVVPRVLGPLAGWCLRSKSTKKNKKLHKKFVEVAWRVVTHTSVFLLGISNLLRVPWSRDTGTCWKNYPHTTVPTMVYWYYMAELGVYLHEFVSIFGETRKSDFWAMVVHHVSTVTLISASYLLNFIPVGYLVMVLHDPVDVVLETAKVLFYMGRARPWALRAANHLFIVFAVTYFVTRLVLYPFIILRASLFGFQEYMDWFPGATLINFFLVTLQFLHIFWMSLIIKSAVKKVVSGADTVEDSRSDDEEDGTDGEEEDDGEDGNNYKKN